MKNAEELNAEEQKKLKDFFVKEIEEGNIDTSFSKFREEIKNIKNNERFSNKK